MESVATALLSAVAVQVRAFSLPPRRSVAAQVRAGAEEGGREDREAGGREMRA